MILLISGIHLHSNLHILQSIGDPAELERNDAVQEMPFGVFRAVLQKKLLRSGKVIAVNIGADLVIDRRTPVITAAVVSVSAVLAAVSRT